MEADFAADNVLFGLCARYEHLSLCTDQPSPRHVRPGEKLVPFENTGVRVLHGAPQPQQGGVYIQAGRVCAQPLHRISREGENALLREYSENSIMETGGDIQGAKVMRSVCLGSLFWPCLAHPECSTVSFCIIHLSQVLAQRVLRYRFVNRWPVSHKKTHQRNSMKQARRVVERNVSTPPCCIDTIAH